MHPTLNARGRRVKRPCRMTTISPVHRLPDDLNLLQALDVLLAERHVTRAAKKLGVTQSAASQRLRRLRDFFGDPLLVDGRPLMSLTPRALALSGPLRDALARLASALGAGEPFEPTTSTRRFVLIGNDLVEAAALPALMAHLGSSAPGVRVQMERSGPNVAERLGTGGADLAIVPAFQTSPSLRHRKLFRDHFVVLWRRDHPAAKKPLSMDRYLALSHLLIAPQGAPGSVVDDHLAERGLSRRVQATVRHFAAAPFLVASSDLVATCPRSLATMARAALPRLAEKALPFEVPATDIALVWHDRVQQDPGHVWFRGVVESVARGGARR
jgi:DNA-binding transcriptional LysR family regulator